MPVVKLPDGTTAQFPEGTSPADMQAAIEAHLGVKPPPPPPPTGTQPGNAFTSPHPLDTLWANAKEAGPQLLDIGKGMVKGGIHTMAGADNFAAKHLPAWFTTPIGSAGDTSLSDLVTGETPQQRSLRVTRELATPHNALQSGGKALEQTLEFMAPTGIEEGLGKLGGAALGKIGKFGGKVAGSALHTGAVNDLQGGSFAGGAAMGAAGSAVGQGISALAPIIAEKAIGVRALDRAYGRTPGRAILDETKGFRPGKIADQAQKKVADYAAELDNNALNSTAPVDLKPAKAVASSFQKTANLQNNDDTIRDIATISKQLMERAGTPIPDVVSAHEGLALKRGLGSLTDYNPTMTQGLGDTAVKGTVSAMQPELARAIPGYEGLNEKLSTLSPAAKRAGATDLNESLAARVLTRMGAKTGALALAGLGGTEGYRKNGLTGAVLGGLGGLVAPEVLTNPTLLMGLSRGANSPALQKFAIPAVNGLALQFGRNKPK